MPTSKFTVLMIFTAAAIFAAGCLSEPSTQKWPESAPVSGAAALLDKNTIQTSPYYTRHDFYNGGSSPTLKQIKKFRTCQQTTEYTCGAASLWMVLNHWGMADKTERALAEELDIRPETNPKNGAYGCFPAALEVALKRRGISIHPKQKFDTEEAFAAFVKKQISSDLPILVEWVAWGGHWCVIIGYDDMGTEATNDDVLIMADPYDTTDHCQDGYTIVSLERFFYKWLDAGVISPGKITRQHYIAPQKPKRTN